MTAFVASFICGRNFMKLAGGLNIPGKILSKTRTMKLERKNSSPKEGTGA
jgi:hypothetical protein